MYEKFANTPLGCFLCTTAGCHRSCSRGAHHRSREAGSSASGDSTSTSSPTKNSDGPTNRLMGSAHDCPRHKRLTLSAKAGVNMRVTFVMGMSGCQKVDRNDFGSGISVHPTGPP